MKKYLLVLTSLTIWPLHLFATDRVLPAQADTIARESANLGSSAKARPDNFGAGVLQEAKALRAADSATRKKFGKSIAAQRREAVDHLAQGGISSSSAEASPSSALGNLPQRGHASAGAGRPTVVGQAPNLPVSSSGNGSAHVH